MSVMSKALVADELFDDEQDLLYEEDILRNAYSLKYWWRYIEAKRRSPPKQRNMICERALKYLPGSYKIWHSYLSDRLEQVPVPISTRRHTPPKTHPIYPHRHAGEVSASI